MYYISIFKNNNKFILLNKYSNENTKIDNYKFCRCIRYSVEELFNNVIRSLNKYRIINREYEFCFETTYHIIVNKIVCFLRLYEDDVIDALLNYDQKYYFNKYEKQKKTIYKLKKRYKKLKQLKRYSFIYLIKN